MELKIFSICLQMRVNKPSVNPDKTEFMVIGNPHRTNKVADLPPFFLGRNQINRVNKTKKPWSDGR